jgi:hypothetical protein
MPRERRISNRVAAIAASGLALGAAAVLVASQGGCLTTPPPDLPAESLRPTILHDSVEPPVNEPLTTWPLQEVSVPVQVNEPGEQICWVVFIDYDPYNPNGVGLVGQKPTCQFAPSSLDGGVLMIWFMLEPGALDLGVCHQIEFIVATNFEGDQHTPVQPPGGDDVVWNYVPGGGSTCPLSYDAAEFGDGAFPSSDAMPIAPANPDGAAASGDSGSP